MALSAAKYRRVPDLFVTGTEIDLGDGLVMWMQALNPFEQDEARHDAATARSRITLALKSEAGSEERTKVEGAFWQDGPQRALRNLIEAGSAKRTMRALDEVENDPEWTERLDVIKRSEEITSRPDDDLERVYLNQVNQEYLQEISKRISEMQEVEEHRLGTMSDQELLEAFIDAYLERRGAEMAINAHRITEIWYAARVCEAERLDDGGWNHARCEGHQMRVFDSKDHVRQLPAPLQELLGETMQDLNMTARDARFSLRQGSSSASSPLPSEAAASTASFPTGTPSTAPGTSPSRSATP